VDTDRFDSMARTLAVDGVSRRTSLKVLAFGGLASLFGRPLTADAKPRGCGDKRCRRKNWCVNRQHTCGPANGFGKCLIKKNGGNVCAEILFQAETCSACREPNCTNCLCTLAAGGGDRCNNGVNGFDFVCARRV